MYVCICIYILYIYIHRGEIEREREICGKNGVRGPGAHGGPKIYENDCLTRKVFLLGFGQLFGFDPRQIAFLLGFGPQDGPRPLTSAPRAAQDRPHRPQERPKTAHIRSKSRPRPPTQAHQLDDRPSVENVEDKLQILYMLPVNFSTDHPSTI